MLGVAQGWVLGPEISVYIFYFEKIEKLLELVSYFCWE
jgi:hypothetical protein